MSDRHWSSPTGRRRLCWFCGADGRPWGLRQVSDLLPGPDSSNPRNSHIIGERLLFHAEDQHATQIWQIPLSALKSLRLRSPRR